jgi:hypothetical protein
VLKVPEELKAMVLQLTGEVHGLREELAEANDRAESAESAAKRTRSWVQVLGLAFLVSVIVTAVTVAGLFRYAATNRAGSCSEWKATANQKVLPTSGEPLRSFIRTAAANYDLINCEALLGPLGDVDPGAYMPAPPPSPTPSG